VKVDAIQAILDLQNSNPEEVYRFMCSLDALRNVYESIEKDFPKFRENPSRCIAFINVLATAAAFVIVNRDLIEDCVRLIRHDQRYVNGILGIAPES